MQARIYDFILESLVFLEACVQSFRYHTYDFDYYGVVFFTEV